MTEFEAGQHWGYRVQRRGGQLTEVRVVRVGVRRPARVLVEFLDEAFEGRREWVPPGRLKVLWAEAGAWLAEESHEITLEDTLGHLTDAEHHACGFVFAELYTDGWIPLEPWSVFGIRADKLLKAVGLTPSELLAADPLATYTEEGILTGSWSTGVAVASAAATTFAEVLLPRIKSEEECYRQKMDAYTRERPENADRMYTEVYEPRLRGLALAREWCGGEKAGLFEELRDARREIDDLRRRLREAESRLAAAQGRLEAMRERKRLKKERGVTVDLNGETAERLYVTVEQAAEFLAVGRGKIFAMIKAGRLESEKIWGSRRIPFAALKRLGGASPERRTPDDDPAADA